MTNAISQFPPIWEIATIVDNDATAAAKWASIQPNIPDIAPKVRFNVIEISARAPADGRAAEYFVEHHGCCGWRGLLALRPGLLVVVCEVYDAEAVGIGC